MPDWDKNRRAIQNWIALVLLKDTFSPDFTNSESSPQLVPSMSRRTLSFYYLFALLLVSVSIADGQVPSSRFFVEGHFSANMYDGERSTSTSTGLSRILRRLGPSGIIGIGYTLNQSFDLIGEFAVSNYPGITTNSGTYDYIFQDESSENLNSFSTTIRYRFWRLWGFEPFLASGFGLTFGRLNNNSRFGIGPKLGVGVSHRFFGLELVATASQHYVAPNSAIDLAGSGYHLDVLSAASLGIRYRFKAPKPRLGQISISGPHTLDAESEGIFTASTDLDPSEYTVRWDFGDGSSATGRSVRHSFSIPGTYQILTTVFYDNSSSQSAFEVTVQTVFERVKLVSLSIFPNQANVGDRIVFTPILTGNQVLCSWVFGDGTSADTCETEHIYDRAGTYRVRFTASNKDHSHTSNHTVVVHTDACSQLPKLSSVFFPAHSSVLSLEMRQVLRANMATSSACTERSIEISGSALSTERNAENLAAARASQVYQYYRNLGISSNRVHISKSIVIPVEKLEGLPWTARSVNSQLVSDVH